MPILLGFFALLSLWTALPQDSLDLRLRYGNPEFERFAIRPGITMTADYGSDGKSIRLEIEPGQVFVPGSSWPTPLLSEQIAADILNEVAPPATRGKFLGPEGAMQVGSVTVSFDLYEEMQISIVRTSYPEPGGVLKLQVEAWSWPNASADFHARYLRADIEEFPARPHFILRVAYAEDGQACSMRIEPRRKQDTTNGFARVDEVADLLNELVPPETRGEQLGLPNKLEASCSDAPIAHYQNVTINPDYLRCRTSLRDRGVELRFRQLDCPAVSPYSQRVIVRPARPSPEAPR